VLDRIAEGQLKEMYDDEQSFEPFSDLMVRRSRKCQKDILFGLID
jgi:hypothetical protein